MGGVCFGLKVEMGESCPWPMCVFLVVFRFMYFVCSAGNLL